MSDLFVKILSKCKDKQKYLKNQLLAVLDWS